MTRKTPTSGGRPPRERSASFGSKSDDQGPRGAGSRPPRDWRKPRAGPRPAPRDRRNEGGDDDGPLFLFGIHAVEAALRNPARIITRVLATENAENRLAEALASHRVTVERVSPRDLDRLLGADTVHQGIAIETVPAEEPLLADLVTRAEAGGGPIVVLDQVTDPHNVGAILRSAAVFGASGVVMTRRHSPPLNGTLAKSASGALELVPVALVGNLAQALAELGKAHVIRLGLEGSAEMAIEDAPLAGPVALVLGAEGKGLRQLTRESCDHLICISASGPLASLNVSNAAAISLHLAALRRRGRG